MIHKIKALCQGNVALFIDTFSKLSRTLMLDWMLYAVYTPSNVIPEMFSSCCKTFHTGTNSQMREEKKLCHRLYVSIRSNNSNISHLSGGSPDSGDSIGSGEASEFPWRFLEMEEQVNPLKIDHSLCVVLPGGLEKNVTVHGR